MNEVIRKGLSEEGTSERILSDGQEPDIKPSGETAFWTKKSSESKNADAGGSLAWGRNSDEVSLAASEETGKGGAWW